MAQSRGALAVLHLWNLPVFICSLLMNETYSLFLKKLFTVCSHVICSRHNKHPFSIKYFFSFNFLMQFKLCCSNFPSFTYRKVPGEFSPVTKLFFFSYDETVFLGKLTKLYTNCVEKLK